MPQRAVNVNITDWQTGGTFSGGTVEFVSMHPNQTHSPQGLTIQVQDSTGEWIDVTGDLSNKGYNVDPTPTGFVVEIHKTGRTELTATFDIVPKVIDRRLRVDLVAASMSAIRVWQFEYVHAIGGSYYARYVFKRYAAQLNHTQPCRKVSWRRLSWKQKARAIAMAEECGWYDDYYYGRA